MIIIIKNRYHYILCKHIDVASPATNIASCRCLMVPGWGSQGWYSSPVHDVSRQLAEGRKLLTTHAGCFTLTILIILGSNVNDMAAILKICDLACGFIYQCEVCFIRDNNSRIMCISLHVCFSFH